MGDEVAVSPQIDQERSAADDVRDAQRGFTERFGGTVVKSTGDGHLATFDGPTQAIRCAEALRTDAETPGIETRTAAASSCVACPAPGNSWRWTATARRPDLPKQSWHRCRPPAVGPRCAARTAPWR